MNRGWCGLRRTAIPQRAFREGASGTGGSFARGTSDFGKRRATKKAANASVTWTWKSPLESLSARAPVLIGVEHDGIPTTFQTTYRRHLAGNTSVFSGLVGQGGSRKRVG